MRVWHRDPLYFACIVAMAAVALLSLAQDFFLRAPLVHISALGALASLLVALALSLRHRPTAQVSAALLGAVVVVACGAQLILFVLTGIAGPAGFPLLLPSWYFSAGMFCVGMAVLLDRILPRRWGRYWMFGLLGAVALALGGLGLLGLAVDLPLAGDSVSARIGSLPDGLILLCAGMAVLAASPVEPTTAVRERNGLVAALMVLLIALFATALVWREAVQQAGLNQTRHSEESLARFASALLVETVGVSDLLDGVRGLFAASDAVTANEWATYLHYAQIRPRYESVFALVYAQQVLPSAQFEDGRRYVQSGGQRLRIWPDTPHADYYPVVYVYPDTQTTRKSLGYDIGANVAFRDALNTSQKSEQVVISRRIAFGDFQDPGARTGFMLIAPVAVGGAAIGTDAAGSGMVMAALDIGVLVARARQASGEQLLSVRIEELDARAAPEPLYVDTDFRAERPAVSHDLDVLGQRWQLSAQARISPVAAQTSRAPAAILAGGVFSALALFALSWVLVGHRERALRLAASMTAQLRRSQRQQRAINDTANAAILIADADGDIVYMNPFAERMFAVAAADSVGQSLASLMPLRYRAFYMRWLRRVRRLGAGQSLGDAAELIGMRKDGSEFPLEVLLSSWSSEGELFFAAIIRDISRRRRMHATLKQNARELLRSNAELEQFAYVASHDLQEPLRMVTSYLELLQQRYHGQLDRNADEFIGYAKDGATRMQQLIRDLLDYAQLGREAQLPVAVSIKTSVDAALAHLQAAIKDSGATFHVDVDGLVWANPGQLVRVFQNLIGNALKFRGAQSPEIGIFARRDGENWHVRVSDNGIGIDPAFRQRVFAIFQRLHTRSEYSGTGIGLAICRKIIEEHNGRIWVEAAPVRGSVFHFILPAASSSR